jgi:hypothetical protein
MLYQGFNERVKNPYFEEGKNTAISASKRSDIIKCHGIYPMLELYRGKRVGS